MTTENALQQIKVNNAVGPDNVSASVLRDKASRPYTCIHFLVFPRALNKALDMF